VTLPESYNERNIMQQGLLSGLVEEQVESAKLLENMNLGEYKVNSKEVNLEDIDALTKEREFVVVKRGDFLCKIIQENFGYFREQLLNDLINENPDIKDPDYILPGQVIKLPATKEIKKSI
jgi:hypothetical protein